MRRGPPAKAKVGLDTNIDEIRSAVTAIPPSAISTGIIRRHDTDAITIGDLLRKSRGSFVDSVRYAVEAGHRLKAKKAELKQRGEQWLPWLKANAEVLGFGEAPERQAQRLMRAAEKYDAGVVFGEAEAVGNGQRP